MIGIGKAILAAGILLMVIGAVLILAAKTGLPLGRLPGDIAYRGKHFSVYIPLGTSILLSILLAAILYLWSRLHR
jgi:hypothetical protein